MSLFEKIEKTVTSLTAGIKYTVIAGFKVTQSPVTKLFTASFKGNVVEWEKIENKQYKGNAKTVVVIAQTHKDKNTAIKNALSLLDSYFTKQAIDNFEKTIS